MEFGRSKNGDLSYFDAHLCVDLVLRSSVSKKKLMEVIAREVFRIVYKCSCMNCGCEKGESRVCGSPHRCYPGVESLLFSSMIYS